MIRWFTGRLVPQIWNALQKWQADDSFTLSASVAYYAAFSFFPLILVLVSGLGFVLRYSPLAEDQQRQLLQFIANQTSPAVADQVPAILRGVQSNAAISGPVGLATLVFGAIGIFTQLEVAFDRIWNIAALDKRRRTIWRIVRNALFTRFRAFLMLLALGLIVIVGFVAGMAVSAVGHYAKDLPLGPFVFHAVQVAVSAVLNTLIFTLIYRTLPKRPVRWRDALAGAALAGLAWEIGRQLLALFLVGGSYSAYGVVGSFILIMLWFNYASMVLFFGAEYVEIASRRAGAEILESRTPATTLLPGQNRGDPLRESNP